MLGKGWAMARLQLGDGADPGGKNSGLTSSGFVLRSSRARIRAELGGHGFCPRNVLQEQE